MARRIIALLVFGSLLLISLPAGMVAQAQPPVLILTAQDSGKTFNILTNSDVIIRLPRLLYTQAKFDPRMLSLLRAPRPGEADGEWRFWAFGTGRTSLFIEQNACDLQPCPPGAKSTFFAVTLVLWKTLPQTYTPPPVTFNTIYIGTAMLNQTVAAKVGDVVTLDLPSLALSRPVRVQFNPAILMPLPPSQVMTYPQNGGWKFRVVSAGSTPVYVFDRACSDSTSDCGLLFKVTVSAS
ncbi:MAG: hypothetical protein IT324_16175 [Anaerolineae bacterium]|nr:hypothetical protein [Anaerolineae bacterium]